MTMDPKELNEEELVSSMIYRLAEGIDEAIYLFGVNKDGVPIGISKEQLSTVSYEHF